jgi:hypothetical protein
MRTGSTSESPSEEERTTAALLYLDLELTAAELRPGFL